MPWFRVDDGFWSHPKTLQLSDGAQALWMRAGSWSMHHLTDGVIPGYALPLLRAKPRFVNELLAVSLWFSDEDAYRFHDWDRYQPTREQVEADRDAAAERKRRSREKSRRDRGGTDGRSSGDAAPSPSQPIPTHPTSISNEIEVSLSDADASDAGTLLDDSWRPNQKHIDLADSLHLDKQRTFERFVDHARRNHRRQKNWNTAFTNWLQKDAQFAQQRQGRPQQQSSRGTRRDDELLAFMTRDDNNDQQQWEIEA